MTRKNKKLKKDKKKSNEEILERNKETLKRRIERRYKKSNAQDTIKEKGSIDKSDKVRNDNLQGK